MMQSMTIISAPASLISQPKDERKFSYIDQDSTMDNVQATADSKYHAVITPNEPYKFMSVSDELAALFDFAPEQMRGRSIKMLQGPRTNAPRLGAAIKSARLHHTSEVQLSAYSRNGSELSLVISCSPHCDAGGETDGVELKFLPVCDCTSAADKKPIISNEITCTHPAIRPVLPISPDVQCTQFSPRATHRLRSEKTRALYNRCVGRELTSELQGKTSKRAAAAEGNDDLLLSLLLRGVEVE